MALADYDTAEEKIAALKCALMDPALVLMKTGTLNVTEDIYLVTRQFGVNYNFAHTDGDTSLTVFPKVSNGNTVSSVAGWAFLYIKNSDILYSDPITTYKNRLVSIMESELSVTSTFTAGQYGSIILSVPKEWVCSVNGYTILYNQTPTLSLCTPVMPNSAIIGSGHHIDLPADW